MGVDHAEIEWCEENVGVSDRNEHGPVDLLSLAQCDMPDSRAVLTAGSPAKVETSGWMVMPEFPLMFVNGEYVTFYAMMLVSLSAWTS